jgi:hypothetical protein
MDYPSKYLINKKLNINFQQTNSKLITIMGIGLHKSSKTKNLPGE